MVLFLGGTGKGIMDDSCLLCKFLMNKNANNSIRVPTPTLNIFTSLTNPKKPKKKKKKKSSLQHLAQAQHLREGS